MRCAFIEVDGGVKGRCGEAATLHREIVPLVGGDDMVRVQCCDIHYMTGGFLAAGWDREET